jgi:hypothetical protein
MLTLPPALAHLATYPQFFLYRVTQVQGEPKPRKVPVNAHTLEAADAHVPSNWVDAATACARAATLGAPYLVGFSFQPGNCLFFIDIDDCLTAEGWSPLAVALCARFPGAAVEVSQSGRGLHIIARGTAPPHACKNVPLKIECYTEYRGVALTGTHAVGDASTDHTAALAAMVAEYFPPRTGDGLPDGEWSKEPRADWRGSEDDADLIRRARQSRSAASHFAVRATFEDLWTRNVDALSKAYPDPLRAYDESSADAALAAHLAFWTGCNCERMERLMRQSELVREKWERHDYLPRTILGAAARQREVLRDKPVPQAVGEDGIRADAGVSITDFFAHMPSHNYLFVPTRELWPSSSVNGRVNWPMKGEKAVRPSDWLDRHRPIEQMTWHPSEDMLVHDRVMQVSGWAPHVGATVFNLYRPPMDIAGDADLAKPWLDHLHRVYPAEADHITMWLAHRIQFPGDKCNHALVLGGSQGIGKDTILEPIKAGVGPWNWQDVAPAQMLGRFNGWAKATVIRVNEARDLGDVDRYAFYDHSKGYIAAPPDVLRVDEKNLREHYVANVCGLIITTNHKTDGLYLPADDRRHFVAWSEAKREEFDADYWTRLYGWYENGIGHVVAYLRQLDLSGFDPKAPPPKTAAFWAMVQAGEAPESGELRDVLEQCGDPECLTLIDLIQGAEALKLFDLAGELKDRRNRRSLPHKLERVGYVPVRNPDADDGLFKILGKRQTVYALRQLSLASQIKAARAIR